MEHLIRTGMMDKKAQGKDGTLSAYYECGTIAEDNNGKGGVKELQHDCLPYQGWHHMMMIIMRGIV